MLRFLDLPLELLPVILQNILKPHHLALCCLVNKAFASFSTPQLYRRIFIYAWHKQGKLKVTTLFKTLSECPHLAKWVTKLELRDFPKAIYSTESYDSLTSTCLRGLANCINLQSCTWTRDRTLSSEILDVLSSKCPALKQLEINGHATGTYNPNRLLHFSSLTKISLIMPSSEVIDILPIWLQITRETLNAFHVLCKATTLITDLTLETVAPYMTHLKHFHVAGCPRVTHKGILSIFSHNLQGLESLGLEGLSSTFDLAALCDHATLLSSLTSLTLSLPPNFLSSSYSSTLSSLTAQSRLEELHIYLIGGYHISEPRGLITAHFVDSILQLHAFRLRKFSVHRLRLQPEVVGNICSSCPNLESLFVVINASTLDQLVPALAKSKSLRNIHINFPHTGQGGRIPHSEVHGVASRLGSQVRQLGFANHVYQLDRVVRLNEANEVIVEVVLASYEQPEVPEQFLVVRT
ncbi:hypothetical protein K439DRAFT_1637353 [Ramaria rubella]|nr:hypothetical protein K439DRAFT_1637353 [Ramaria rubella]